MDELRSLLSTNQSDRLKREKAAQDRIDDPRLPRHTVYKGDRKIQQLGQDTIENGVIINNQSLEIGEVMLPLAKGNVLRRVDKTNGGALLGTAYRDAVENDFDANGERRETDLGRNGGNESSSPSSPSSPSKPKKNPPRVRPPFGCVPPPPQCFWSTSPTAPQGFQSYGDAVVNENAVPVYLYCVAGSSVPANLGCDFLDPPVVTKYSCSGGVCSPDPNGIYNSLAACEAATYFIEVTVIGRFVAFDCVNRRSRLYYAATPNTTLTLVPNGNTDTQCGGSIIEYDLTGSDIGFVGAFGGNSVSATIIRACSLPPSTNEDI